MNILQVCFSDGAGGLEMYLANTAAQLRARGHAVFAVVPPNTYLQKRLSELSLPHACFAPRLPYLDLALVWKLSRLLKMKKIDIIHAHQSRDLSVLILAKKMARRGKLVFTQQMETSRAKKDIFHRWVYQNLDLLLAITERIKNQAAENTHLPAERLARLYYGLDINRYSPDQRRRAEARARYGISADEIVIGILGRLEAGKGQHLLIEAVGKISPEIPNLKLMIIGAETVGQSGYLAELKRLCGSLGLEQKIIFTGFQPDVPVVTAALDIVVLASKKETFGLSLIECMAQGIAPIGTDAGGVPEIISHGESGFLVPPLDVEILADRLRTLATKGELRLKFSAAARKTVAAKFCLRNHLRQLEARYEKLC